MMHGHVENLPIDERINANAWDLVPSAHTLQPEQRNAHLVPEHMAEHGAPSLSPPVAVERPEEGEPGFTPHDQNQAIAPSNPANQTIAGALDTDNQPKDEDGPGDGLELNHLHDGLYPGEGQEHVYGQYDAMHTADGSPVEPPAATDGSTRTPPPADEPSADPVTEMPVEVSWSSPEPAPVAGPPGDGGVTAPGEPGPVATPTSTPEPSDWDGFEGTAEPPKDTP